MKQTKKDYVPDPRFKDLPKNLKDPKCFKGVMKKVAEAEKAPHKHLEIGRWLGCKTCQDAFKHKRNVIEKLGFKSYQQFLQWRKVMGIIHYYKKHVTKRTKSKRGAQAKKVQRAGRPSK